MISKEEIKRLADLARIKIAEDEAQSLALEIDAILGYVGQVKSVVGQMVAGAGVSNLRNIFREDSNPNVSGAQSKELIAEFPASEKNYLKVKKVL
jgi:aspartyl-tRNA(Asn)/glutamyl-tRNA(Gln) amidotransferase subunit C